MQTDTHAMLRWDWKINKITKGNPRGGGVAEKSSGLANSRVLIHGSRDVHRAEPVAPLPASRPLAPDLAFPSVPPSDAFLIHCVIVLSNMDLIVLSEHHPAVSIACFKGFVNVSVTGFQW